MSGPQQLLVAGGSGVVNPIPISSFGDLAIDPADAQATLTFDTDGSGSMVGVLTENFSWHLPETVGIGALYWIRLTVNSGSSPSGSATATWLQLNAARSWFIVRASVGSNSGNYTLQIATDSGGANIIASATITMTADVET